MIVSNDGLSIEIPDDATSTTEVAEDTPTTTRYFFGHFIVACTVSEGTDVPTALGAVVEAYRDVDGYTPGFVKAREVEGAGEASSLSFDWVSESDVPMVSKVLVASDGSRAATVHLAFPAVVRDRAEETSEQILSTVALR